MADYRKVANGLECCLNGPMQCEKCRYRADDGTTVTQCIKTLREDAIALLKAQEPEKPIYKQFIHRVNYCPRCGKAVKWDD